MDGELYYLYAERAALGRRERLAIWLKARGGAVGSRNGSDGEGTDMLAQRGDASLLRWLRLWPRLLRESAAGPA